ncbi:MAG: acetylglutamate kinase [Anaerolineae bacterium]|nr:acetylglutamate kinase [Anaerolineae bacterium]MEB2286569.1 acetylglutamate kinase [Anaerolineae bacterium]
MDAKISHAEALAPLVIKVGGNDLDRPGFLDALAATVAGLAAERRCVLVHGGGRAINEVGQAFGLQPVYVDGQRVTDQAALDVAEMVLSGQVNKQIVRALLAAGVDALGLSGVDRGLLRVEPWAASLGRVGRIVAVRADVLRSLCAAGAVPVVSPISLGPDGAYNVNADHAAGAIAAALGAARATFVTNVPGVRAENGVVPRLSVAETLDLIARGVINGGMIPKVQAALAAVGAGVRQAVITDLTGLATGTGTVFVA